MAGKTKQEIIQGRLKTGIKANISKKTGDIISYQFRTTFGRDAAYNALQANKTIKAPKGLTPAKEADEVNRLFDVWVLEQKESFAANGTPKEDNSKLTLHQFIDDVWLPLRVNDGKKESGTQNFYFYMAKVIKRYFPERKTLISIKPIDILNFLKWLENEAVDERSGTLYSDSQKANVQGAIKNIMRFATKLKYIPENPFFYLDSNDLIHKKPKKVKFLAPDDAQQFVKALDNEDTYYRTMYYLYISVGLRRGECVGLKWKDIDFAKKTMAVVHSVVVDPDSDRNRKIKDTKTHRERTVCLPVTAVTLLKQLYQEQKAMFTTVFGENFIFYDRNMPDEPGVSPQTIPCNPNLPNKHIKDMCEKYNLKPVTVQQLRHTAATLALFGGSNLKEVQDMLGHTDAHTTMTHYAGVVEEAKRNTANNVDNILQGRQKVDGESAPAKVIALDFA